MRIELNDGTVSTTPAMLQYVHQKIAASLGRFAGVVDAVCVSVRDVNGPRGGVDTRCTIRATVNRSGQGVLIAEEYGQDFYAAVANATRKIRAALRHSLDRSRRD